MAVIDDELLNRYPDLARARDQYEFELAQSEDTRGYLGAKPEI